MSFDDPGKQSHKGIPVLTVFILMFVAAILGGIVVLGAVQAGLLGNVGQTTSSGNTTGNTATGSTLPQQTLSVNYDDVVVQVAEKVSPAIVCISNRDTYNDFFQGETTEVEQGTGSGVIYSTDGYIVTNNHVIEGASRVVVTLYDGREVDATLVGRDARTDLAVLKIDDTEGLVAAEFGDSDSLKVGEMAIAIGNPGGSEFARSLTQGRISGLNRLLVTQEGLQFRLIQTDAAINPGNSGGALVNAAGQVIGINTIKISASDYEGMGFAIPINAAKEIIEELEQNGKVVRPALGVSIVRDITPDLAKYNNLAVDYGVLVAPSELGPAARAGIQAYDIIIAVNGEKIETGNQLQEAIFAMDVGDEVTVTVQRGNEQKDFKVTLGELSQ